MSDSKVMNGFQKKSYTLEELEDMQRDREEQEKKEWESKYISENVDISETDNTAKKIFELLQERSKENFEDYKILYDSCPAYYQQSDENNYCLDLKECTELIVERRRICYAHTDAFTEYRSKKFGTICILIHVKNRFYAKYICRKNETEFNLQDYLKNIKKTWTTVLVIN